MPSGTYRALLIALAAVATAAIPVAAAVAPHEQRIVGKSRDEKTPAADDGILGYTVIDRHGLPHARISLAGQRAKAIGPASAQTWMGGVDGGNVVIQVIAGSQSDLRAFVAATGRHVKLPRSVNSSLWEYAPTMAHGRLWFLRAGKARTDGMLADLTSGQTKRVVRMSAAKGTLQAGQIGGHFVAYGTCLGSRCTMFRYDVTSRVTVKVPRASRRYDVAPGVASDGTVYFWRSKAGCGSAVRLMRWTPEAGAAVVLSLPKGIDAGKTYVYRGHDDLAQVYYERYRCTSSGRSRADIYRVVDTADPAHPGS